MKLLKHFSLKLNYVINSNITSFMISENIQDLKLFHQNHEAYNIVFGYHIVKYDLINIFKEYFISL